MIEFIVPGTPVPWARKEGRKGGGRYTDPKQTAALLAISQAYLGAKMPQIEDGRALVFEVELVNPLPKRPKPWQVPGGPCISHNRADWDNGGKLPSDALQWSINAPRKKTGRAWVKYLLKKVEKAKMPMDDDARVCLGVVQKRYCDVDEDPHTWIGLDVVPFVKMVRLRDRFRRRQSQPAHPVPSTIEVEQ